MKKSFLSLSSIAILAVVFLLWNSVSNAVLSRFSVDLTEEGLFSLSEGTKNVLARLDEPVVVKYYFSRLDSVRNASVQLYSTRVRDLLEEYERRSGGMLTLEEYDPQPDSENEEWAQKYGLRAISLPTGEQLYFGMVAINASGEEEVIPVFNMNRQETLEYDITKSLYALSRDEMPTVGLLSTLRMQGKPAETTPNGMPLGPETQPWVFVEQLESLAEVKFLSTAVEEIPEDIDVLVVIHPKGLLESALYAIDQFVLRGGSLFVAVDPYSAADSENIDRSNPMAMLTADRSSDLNALTQAWGAKIKGKQVVGDPELATEVTLRRGQAPERFLPWLSFGNEQARADGSELLDSQQVVTSQIDSLLFAWPGALELTEVEGIEVTPLIKTTRQAGLFDAETIKFAAQNPEQLMKEYSASGEQVLAAMMRGKFKSNFTHKPGEEPDEAPISKEGGHLPEGIKPATIMLVADVDFLADDFSASVQNLFGHRLVTLLNENLVFGQNAVELLAGSDELVALRSRGSFLRPFTKVREIEARAQKRWRAEEQRLQQEAQQASQRLSQLQSMTGQEGKAVFSDALLEEIRQLREQRRQTEERLREVRWELRKEKESLGNRLFVLNTFGVPFILVIGAVYISWRRGAKQSIRQ